MMALRLMEFKVVWNLQTELNFGVDGLMTCDFTSLSTAVWSYQADRRIIFFRNAKFIFKIE